MAKKKEEVPKGTLQSIIKDYGNILKTGQEVFDQKKDRINISISLNFDLGLNGGLKEGTSTVVTGPPKCGKTTTILQILANAQKLGRKCIYADVENRLQDYNIGGIEGLNKDDLIIIAPEEGSTKNLAAEDYFTIIERLISSPEYFGAICVIDSTSSMLPRNELDAPASATLRASMPKLFAHFIKKITQIIQTNKISMIFVTHLITNTSGYGKLRNADGGLMIQYQKDNGLEFGNATDWEEDGKVVGKEITCDITCSARGSSGNKVVSWIRFGQGIDFIKEAMQLGESFGLIEKAGAWFTIPFVAGTDLDNFAQMKVQGTAKLYALIKENPPLLEALNKEIRSLLSS
jgi:recombination protein RecA